MISYDIFFKSVQSDIHVSHFDRYWIIKLSS